MILLLNFNINSTVENVDGKFEFAGVDTNLPVWEGLRILSSMDSSDDRVCAGRY